MGLELLLLFLLCRALWRVRWSYHFSRLTYQVMVARYRILGRPVPVGYYLDKTGVWKVSE